MPKNGSRITPKAFKVLLKPSLIEKVQEEIPLDGRNTLSGGENTPKKPCKNQNYRLKDP